MRERDPNPVTFHFPGRDKDSERGRNKMRNNKLPSSFYSSCQRFVGFKYYYDSGSLQLIVHIPDFQNFNFPFLQKYCFNRQIGFLGWTALWPIFWTKKVRIHSKNARRQKMIFSRTTQMVQIPENAPRIKIKKWSEISVRTYQGFIKFCPKLCHQFETFTLSSGMLNGNENFARGNECGYLGSPPHRGAPSLFASV